jgi:hypothetical protein
MTARRNACAAAIVAGLLALPAHAGEPPSGADAIQVGRSIFITNDVDGQTGDAPPRRIAVNDDIVFAEDITTGDAAKAVVEFRDGSTFEIGPNAAVRIDAFIFNPEESTSQKSLSVTRGVFRYVSAYITSEQGTQIKTPTGNIGIRGSVAAGIVDPAVPDFFYLGEGSATFTNTAGSSTLLPGSAIAVPSATTPPMAPGAMPAPVAAQALQVIERRLPPRAALANRPAAGGAWLKRAGAADLVPTGEQQRRAAAAVSRPAPALRGASGLAGELGLLIEANRVELFSGRPMMRTPEQTAFLTRTARENPNAAATMRRFSTEARSLHAASVARGTAFVLHGVGRAAPSAEVMRRVTAASTRANPGAARTIERHAADAYRGPDRRGLQPRNERPGSQRPAAQPRNFERRSGGNIGVSPHPAAPQRQPGNRGDGRKHNERRRDGQR